MDSPDATNNAIIQNMLAAEVKLIFFQLSICLSDNLGIV